MKKSSTQKKDLRYLKKIENRQYKLTTALVLQRLCAGVPQGSIDGLIFI